MSATQKGWSKKVKQERRRKKKEEDQSGKRERLVKGKLPIQSLMAY